MNFDKYKERLSLSFEKLFILNSFVSHYFELAEEDGAQEQVAGGQEEAAPSDGGASEQVSVLSSQPPEI